MAMKTKRPPKTKPAFKPTPGYSIEGVGPGVSKPPKPKRKGY